MARAEPAQVGEAPFVTLDRVDGRSHALVEIALGTGTEEGDLAPHPFSTMRLEAFGQWVERHGVGCFATVGVVKYTFDGDGQPISFPLPEVGGLYARRVDDTLDLVAHVGVAPSLRDSRDDHFGSRFTRYARIADLARDVPDRSWMRLSGSGVTRIGVAVVRIDAGVDVPLADDELGQRHPLSRVGIGAAVTGGVHRLGLEYVAVGNARDVVAGAHQTGAAIYRLVFRKVELFGAVVTALGKQRDPDSIGASLLVGVNVLAR